MKRPFFSVVIPTLNEEKFLPKLLTCLSHQTLQKFEVIVVDGDSEDATITIAKTFHASLPKLSIVTTSKRNVSFQRNLGAQKAKGEYLVFFDADVQIPKNFFKRIWSAIVKKKSMLLTTWIAPDSNKANDIVIIAISNIAVEVAKAIERPFAGGYNTIVHRSVFFQVGGYNEKFKISEDHDFIQRCLAAGVQLMILRRPRLTFSLRRMRRYGYFSIIRKYAQAGVYQLLKKPITKALFEYPMGGHLYRTQKEVRRNVLGQLERSLLRSVKQWLST